MPVSWDYTPPRINGVVLIEAAKSAAEVAGADMLLQKSLPLVPRDTGEMADSGHVEAGTDGARVIFSRSGADGYNVAARQHEDASLSHPGGGEAFFLAKPMHSEQGAILGAMAALVRERLG